MLTWRGSERAGRLSGFLRAHRPAGWRRVVLVGLAYLLGWAVIAVPVAVHAFFADSRATVLAGHDVVVSPTLNHWATFDLGALLPDVRYPTDRRLGVDVDVGATNLDDYNALIQRYAVIASQPEGEIDKVNNVLRGLAVDAAIKGALIGLAGPGLWLLIGRTRRLELLRGLTSRRAIVAGIVATVVVGAGATAWSMSDGRNVATSVAGSATWQPISELLPETKVTGQAARLQVESGLITSGTKTLIQGAFDTYRKSLTFYRDLADRAPGIASTLRQPAEGDTVAILVSDRHDNVGMDAVSRAIADAGGATVLFDAGDDTSTGEPWEAFSLDSINKVFDGYDAYGVAGNHDNGSFVVDYLSDRGFTMLDGEPIDAVDGIRLLGAPDPRSSNLSSGIRPTATSFDDQAAALADTACAADAAGERVPTVIVHDANLGRPALARGCVDLVLSGHLHIQAGPTPVTGSNGKTGTTYTNGTTGGAAYAFALGSKIRRDAEVTLVTYHDGVPLGLQPVMIRTNGDFDVGDYLRFAGTAQQSPGN